MPPPIVRGSSPDKTAFVMQIGDKLRSGEKHDGRAPDYDDWALNGDILFYDEVLGRAFEVSSMGIRVDEKSMDEQLRKAGADDRRSLPFHKAVLSCELPLTMETMITKYCREAVLKLTH